MSVCLSGHGFIKVIYGPWIIVPPPELTWDSVDTVFLLASRNAVTLGEQQPGNTAKARLSRLVTGKVVVGESFEGCLYPSTLQKQRRHTSKDAEPGTQPLIGAAEKKLTNEITSWYEFGKTEEWSLVAAVPPSGASLLGLEPSDLEPPIRTQPETRAR